MLLSLTPTARENRYTRVKEEAHYSSIYFNIQFSDRTHEDERIGIEGENEFLEFNLDLV
jgi:hypothetical protein